VVLKATSISHQFDYPLLENIDFSLQENEIKAILGVSGSGKSTLLHILSSFLKPNQGSVKYNNKDIYQISQKELTNLRKNFIGLIFQQHYLLGDLVLMKIFRYLLFFAIKIIIMKYYKN